MIAYLFAGQGTQHRDMGAEMIRSGRTAAVLYEQISDLLGYDPSRLDDDKLAMTAYAQPAVFACSLAAWSLYRERNAMDEPALFAGFSLGEYAAMTASGALSLPDAVRLVASRAQWMQEACLAHPGSMAAVLGLQAEDIQAVLRAAGLEGRVVLANHNAPLQSVIAGSSQDVRQAGDALKEAGARRVVPLAVSGAFHSPFMAEAAAGLRSAFDDLTLMGTTRGTLYSNVFAAPLLPSLHSRPDPSFAAYLELHMTRPVRWVEEVIALHEAGADTYVECGPGKVLAGLVGKILPGTSVAQAVE